MVYFKEINHFSWFQRGSNIFQGGCNFFQGGGGGSNSLFPIEIHITCDFSGGGSGPPAPPPSGSVLVIPVITLYEKPQDVNEQSGLIFTWSETPKSDYLLQE